MSNDKPTYQDLLNKISQLEKEIDENRICRNELIQAKEFAIESEKQQIALVDNAIYPINITTISGKVIYLNNAAYKFFDLDKNTDLTAINPLEFWVYPEKRKELVEKIIEFGFAGNNETELYTTNKQVKTILLSSSIIDYKGEKVLLSIYNDITEQKKLEISLQVANANSQEKEKLVNALFENTSEGIGISKNGISFMVNEAYIAMFGYENADEIIGKPILNQISPKEHEKVKYFITNRYNGTNLPKCYETIGIKKNGEEFPLEILVGTYQLNSEPYSFGILRNITERKQINHDLIAAKEKAEGSDSKNRTIINNFPNGSITLLDKNLIIQLTGGSEYALHNLQPDSFINKHIKELLNENIFRINEPYISKAFKGESSSYIVDFENLYYRNYICPVLTPKNEIDFVILMSINITDLINAETALIAAKETAEESEHKFRSYIEHAPVGIVLIQNDGKYLDVNTELCKMFGYTKEEFLNNSYKIPIIPEEEYAKAKRSNVKILTEGKYVDEFRFVTKNGTFFYGLMSAVKISDNNTLAFIKNIDNIKKTQQDLIIAKEKAEESDRLKSTFLQNMSHEVRTPLNSIVGFSQLIAKQNKSPEKLKKFSNLIIESSEKLIGIITDVIEISQIQSKISKPKLSEFDIISFLNTIIKNLKIKAIEKNIELQLNIGINLQEYFIQSDKEKLYRIFFHLIDNAIKFTQQGIVNIVCELDNGNIKFAISDTGIGISAEMQKIIFEPFRQVETGICRNFGGNGLGLSLVKAYTELLNGSISLNSEINKGTTFYISIPTNKTNSQTNKESIDKKLYSVNTILIVEDE